MSNGGAVTLPAEQDMLESVEEQIQDSDEACLLIIDDQTAHLKKKRSQR